MKVLIVNYVRLILQQVQDERDKDQAEKHIEYSYAHLIVQQETHKL